jgi:hypothetical protein
MAYAISKWRRPSWLRWVSGSTLKFDLLPYTERDQLQTCRASVSRPSHDVAASGLGVAVSVLTAMTFSPDAQQV